LAAGPAIGEVADIQKQNFDEGVIVLNILRLAMFFRIWECRLSMALVV